MSVAPQHLHGVDEQAVRALVEGRNRDPFAVLGPHPAGDRTILRAFLPGAEAVEAVARDDGRVLAHLAPVEGLFVGEIGDAPYRLRITWPGGVVQDTEDPYRFGPLLGELDLYLVSEGTHYELSRALGAEAMSVDGVAGVRFAVWAPNARRVSVVGDFNSWDGRRHPMRARDGGVWELFLPGIGPGERYKFELVGPNGEWLPQKADPVARASEAAPATASIVAWPEPFHWTDGAWMDARAARQGFDKPLSIYEVHVGSWLRVLENSGRSLDWTELADRLIPYAAGMGFTHIELLPIMEHPFGGSWGYQPLGLFAPTGRYGSPEEFAEFVDRCHAAGIGVILDWVPAHFPSDVFGLARFDGTALYEHEDPRQGYHPDWNTLIYNLGRREVSGFLIASAMEWIERYHVDGLRIDAVASMLYLDYSRKEGEWIPNRYGGRENLEAIDFLRHLNGVVAERAPGVLTIAEESTAWPGVTRPIADGGLGFSLKWNMGWMHDTLGYVELDPIHRRWHHGAFTFGMIYAYSERFVLPISHDEVVHGKGSLIGKMPGGPTERFANLRAYLGFMWAHPGRKLLFMGGEIGQASEWNHDASVVWDHLDDGHHAGVQRLVRDLNRLYASAPALHAGDDDPAGFRWVEANDGEHSVFAFLRIDPATGDQVLAVSNMTPMARAGYRVGVPAAGLWREILNTDAEIYGGGNEGNYGGASAENVPLNGFPFSLRLHLPPLSTVLLRPSDG